MWENSSLHCRSNSLLQKELNLWIRGRSCCPWWMWTWLTASSHTPPQQSPDGSPGARLTLLTSLFGLPVSTCCPFPRGSCSIMKNPEQWLVICEERQSPRQVEVTVGLPKNQCEIYLSELKFILIGLSIRCYKRTLELDWEMWRWPVSKWTRSDSLCGVFTLISSDWSTQIASKLG